MDRIPLTIADAPLETRDWIDIVEPATGQVYATVGDATAADVDRAVQAASDAFGGWSSTPASERSDRLYALADLIDRDTDRLALAESKDTGKPLSVARAVDIPRVALNFRFFAGAILHAEGAFHDMPGSAINYTLRRPRGVAGLISPWNLPLYLLTWKIAPAIATGNSCVCKPSEMSPMSAHLLMELIAEAGIPPGVVNMVHGRGERAGAAIIEHPDVPAISFTGSTRAGSWIARHAGAMLKRYSLELGGKNPNVIFADADLDDAIETSVRAAFSNQGQICLCGSRILVERPVYHEFVDRFVERARSLRIGDPLDDATQVGSLIGEDHLHKVDGLVRLAEDSGGTIRCGGKRAEAPNDRCEGGAFYPPTVITGLDAECDAEQEEIFGPVVTMSPFEDEDEGVRLANGTRYGLASIIWTRDLARAHRVAERIETGIVWVNCWMLRDLRTPFGGTKQSGVGREGGLEALRFFTEPKNVCIRTR